MSGQLQVAVGFPIEFQSIEIPEEVKELTICQGFDRPRDKYPREEDARRKIQLRKTDYGATVKEFLFEHEADGMSTQYENEYIQLLINYLGTLGFENITRGKYNERFEGILIWLSR